MISVSVPEPPAFNLDEIKRYARIMGEDEAADAMIAECIAEAQPALSYQVCYTAQAVIRRGDTLCVGGIRTTSRVLSKALSGCDHALLFAATIGAPYDRLILRYTRLSPAKALIFQALGAERAESLCDAFMRRYAAEHGCTLRTRVSPGYGDIPLTMQRDIFGVLDCPRKIGLTLNESLLMSPSKSVTAFAGITLGEEEPEDNRCDRCRSADCPYRLQR